MGSVKGEHVQLYIQDVHGHPHGPLQLPGAETGLSPARPGCGGEGEVSLLQDLNRSGESPPPAGELSQYPALRHGPLAGAK